MKKSIRTVLFFTMIVIAVFLLAGCETGVTNDPDSDSDSGKDFMDGAKTSDGSAKHFLGKGYDIFSEYALETNVKEPLLDFDAMKAADMLQGGELEDSSVQLISGSTVEDYTTEYNAAIGVDGSYLGFTASVTSTFGSAATSSSTTAFASVIGQYCKYTEKIHASKINASDLTPYMTESFKAVIARIQENPSQDAIITNLFETFGTHVITGAYHGGFLSYSKSTSSSDVTDSNQFGLAVSAGYSAATGDSINTDNSYDSTSYSAKAAESAAATVDARGGDSVYITNAALGGVSPENFGKFLDGFSDNAKWVLSGFTSGDEGKGLFPIAEFFTDPEVKEKVEAAFEVYKEQKKIIVSNDSSSKPTYKATLSFKNENVQCNADDAGSTVEYYGSIIVRFKSDNKTLWSLAENDYFEIEDVHWGSWASVDKGGQTISFETQTLTDTMTFEITFKEDDNGGDDEYVVVTGCKLTYSFNDLMTKIKNDDPYIVFSLDNEGDKALLRVQIAVEKL